MGNMRPTEEWPKYIKNVPYSDKSSLNTLEICLPREPSIDDVERYWIVFIHGGAWRDPLINAKSFRKIGDQLLSSTEVDRIAGCASINYRLSPYPSHSSKPSDPSDPARNARHPDHINDVLTAILYLQENYRFEHRYILSGHSCGATLALQVTMKLQDQSTHALKLTIEQPIAVVGLEGLYHLPSLIKYHEDQPAYKAFVKNAFGNIDLETVSPVNADFNTSWPAGKVAILGHSHGDTLVEWEQVELQRKAFESQGWKDTEAKICAVVELEGDHNEVWETGEAAKAILFALQTTLRLKSQ